MLAVEGADSRSVMAIGAIVALTVAAFAIASPVFAQSKPDRAGHSTSIAQKTDGAPAGPDGVDPRSGVRRAADVAASKAQGVLERHCSRCHQYGHLAHGVAVGGIANVMSVEELARDPAMVRPGLPDASRLYNVLVTRELHHGAAGGADGTWPSRQEIDAVRAWIDEVPPSAQRTCGTESEGRRRGITDGIAVAIRRLGDAGASRMRLVSLAHLADCLTSQEMVGLEQGLRYTLNAVSRKVKAVSPKRIGNLPVWMISLDDLGWKAEQWEALVADYPLQSSVAKLVPAQARSAMKTQIPLVQADWLADVAMRAPNYGRLLGLPDTLRALAARSGIDVDGNIRSGEARRIGIAVSGEVSGARIIERHPEPDAKAARVGSKWLSYELGEGAAIGTGKAAADGTGDAVGKGDGNPAGAALDKPLGPAPHGSEATRFQAQGMRAIFALRNGFPAFALFGADGTRIQRAPAGADRQIAGDRYRGDAALGCLQCHVTGPIAGKGDVRGRFETASSPDLAEERDQVLRIYARPAEHVALVASDHHATRAALLSAGIDPERRVRGLSPPLALAQAWRRPVDAGRLAAELGMPPKNLLSRLARIPEGAPIAARQLLQGTAQREEAMRLSGWLEGQLARGVGAGPPGGARNLARAEEAKLGTATGLAADGAARPEDVTRIGRIDLALWTDGERHSAGDSVVFRAQSSRDCYLTLISVDNDGRATVVFPNDYDRNNRIVAGQAIRVPSAAGGYRFRLAEEGQELLVGICSATHASPKSIVHNYERLRFTVLGDWELFLREPPRLDVAGRDDAATDRPRPLRPRWRRRRKAQVARRPEGPDVSARTAIVIDVEPARR